MPDYTVDLAGLPFGRLWQHSVLVVADYPNDAILKVAPTVATGIYMKVRDSEGIWQANMGKLDPFVPDQDSVPVEVAMALKQTGAQREALAGLLTRYPDHTKVDRVLGGGGLPSDWLLFTIWDGKRNVLTGGIDPQGGINT